MEADRPSAALCTGGLSPRVSVSRETSTRRARLRPRLHCRSRRWQRAGAAARRGPDRTEPNRTEPKDGTGETTSAPTRRTPPSPIPAVTARRGGPYHGQLVAEWGHRQSAELADSRPAQVFHVKQGHHVGFGRESAWGAVSWQQPRWLRSPGPEDGTRRGDAISTRQHRHRRTRPVSRPAANARHGARTRTSGRRRESPSLRPTVSWPTLATRRRFT